MAQIINNNSEKHRIELKGRESLNISGVEDVINFDEGNVVLQTVCGILSVDGEDLHIVNLNVDSGDVSISGTVNGIIYPQSGVKQSGGFFRRMMK